MKKIILLIAFTLSSTSFAGPGHSHGHGHSHAAAAVSKEKAKEIGEAQVQRLVEANKIDVSWKEAKHDQSVLKSFHGKKEWVVTFTNPKDAKEKKLYIFLKQSGEFVAANFTGK